MKLRPIAIGTHAAQEAPSDLLIGEPTHVALYVRSLLQMEYCPEDWKVFDLYLFRDGGTVFYAGQSDMAFRRVWTHIRDGYKARSDVGRFILCNWPRSMTFVVEFWSSSDERFGTAKGDLNAAEAQLIRRYSPCFNSIWNDSPNVLPGGYRQPGSTLRCPRSIRVLQVQAAAAIRQDAQKQWIVEGGIPEEIIHHEGEI